MPDQSPATAVGTVRFPVVVHSPWWVLSRRFILAFATLALCTVIVYAARDGYIDANDPRRGVGFVDALYYSSATLSLSGHGDVAPLSTTARLVDVFAITPLRVAFVVLLISTTLELLAAQGRYNFRVARWRKKMDQHVVVIGYGTKGRSAVDLLLRSGAAKDDIVVVDPIGIALQEANADGLTVVTGDATRREVLRRAGVQKARQVIITTDRDDATVLATLNVRALNPTAYVVAAVREEDNVQLVKQSGADAVITSSAAVGRLLGLSSLSPALGYVMEDLFTLGEGLEVAERELLVSEVGKQPQHLDDQVLAVLRGDRVYRYYEPGVTQLARGDRLIVVRPATELPWAPRPGTHGEATTDDEA